VRAWNGRHDEGHENGVIGPEWVVVLVWIYDEWSN